MAHKLPQELLERLRREGRIAERGKRIVTPALVEQGRAKVAKTVASFTLLLPIKLPGLNEILRVKANRWRGTWNAMKVEWQGVVTAHWADFGKPRVTGRYVVAYEYLCADRRMDPSNRHAGSEKIFLDAMVNCGALPGDGMKWHCGSSYSVSMAAGDAIRITVTTVEDSF